MIVVNYNGLGHLRNCFTSLQSLVSSRARIELIMIDNGSTDESIAYVTKKFPAIRILANPENNYARALNLGIAAAQGEYVGFVNNDVTVDPGWLDELLAALDAQGAAAAGGKILLKNGRINSVGIQPLPNFYWVDIGFNERDRGQYDTAREVEALCWASVLFRRESLDDVGAVDEDFVMYCEDVD